MCPKLEQVNRWNSCTRLCRRDLTASAIQFIKSLTGRIRMLKFAPSIHRSRRKRQIRVKLDEVSRVIASYFRTGTDCALLTADGDLLTAKGVQPRPFLPLVPKIRSLRANATAISAALAVAPPKTIHVRGGKWMAAVYALGPHSLVVFTGVHLSVHDSVIRDVDVALAVAGSPASGPVADLADLVKGLC